jgi:hypothetical protein
MVIGVKKDIFSHDFSIFSEGILEIRRQNIIQHLTATGFLQIFCCHFR